MGVRSLDDQFCKGRHPLHSLLKTACHSSCGQVSVTSEQTCAEGTGTGGGQGANLVGSASLATPPTPPAHPVLDSGSSSPAAAAEEASATARPSDLTGAPPERSRVRELAVDAEQNVRATVEGTSQPKEQNASERTPGTPKASVHRGASNLTGAFVIQSGARAGHVMSATVMQDSVQRLFTGSNGEPDDFDLCGLR
jgi:hypothetical protein